MGFLGALSGDIRHHRVIPPIGGGGKMLDVGADQARFYI